YSIVVVGEQRSPLRDFYHSLLRRSWWVTIATISAAFLVTNALFAAAYLLTGGVVHGGETSFANAFFFSVQTMGTIGYGAMYPESPAANTLVVVESIVSLLLTALSTGLVFAKFSRSTARIVFSDHAVISPSKGGVPTLMFRMGNLRGNEIVDAQIRVVFTRTERYPDGSTFYRMSDLKLTRERALSLSRSWSALHPITGDSPFVGHTPDSCLTDEVELQVMVVGLDDVTMQPVHATHRYLASHVLWGARHADILSESPDGNLLLDLRKFNVIEPSVPTPDFPYPKF
ncbi:MAG TPA: ion channel, partial [Polyangia bacterium]|nr:ion channel [Polyangia bacterium]